MISARLGSPCRSSPSDDGLNFRYGSGSQCNALRSSSPSYALTCTGLQQALYHQLRHGPRYRAAVAFITSAAFIFVHVPVQRFEHESQDPT